jgi:hypothetical protein
MAIDREDPEEQQARLNWMIDEFQEARRRRLVKVGDGDLESHTDTDVKATVRTDPASSS